MGNFLGRKKSKKRERPNHQAPNESYQATSNASLAKALKHQRSQGAPQGRHPTSTSSGLLPLTTTASPTPTPVYPTLPPAPSNYPGQGHLPRNRFDEDFLGPGPPPGVVQNVTDASFPAPVVPNATPWNSNPNDTTVRIDFHPQPPPPTQREDGNDGIGIQGRDNSCYMDSILTSLFIYNSKFSDRLRDTREHLSKLSQEEIGLWMTLCDEIVSVLHQTKRLPYSSSGMTKFRMAMNDVNPDAGYESRQLDVEEFTCTLFEKILKWPPFYTCDGGGGYVFQTFPRRTTRPLSPSTDVQELLRWTFAASDVELDRLPYPGFLVKMPVTNGRHVFQEIIPNRNILLHEFLKQDAKEGLLVLTAAICLRNNHFTSFVNLEGPKGGDWVYLDSFQYPKVTRVPILDKILRPPKSDGDLAERTQFLLSELGSLLVSHLYLCVYMSPVR